MLSIRGSEINFTCFSAIPQDTETLKPRALKVARNSIQQLILMRHYNHSLSLDAIIMVSKKLPNHW